MSFSKPPITRRHFLTIAGVTAGSWFYPAFAKNTDNPLEQALAVWKMATVDGTGRYPIALKEKGGKESRLGEKLSGTEYAESLLRGGNGLVANVDNPPVADFFGTLSSDENYSWLSVGLHQTKKLRPDNSAISFYVRTFFDKPDGWGTLFFSDFLSLAMHQDGLAIAFLGQETKEGITFRELPLGVLERGTWLDLIIRIGNQTLEFFCNGELISSIFLTNGLGAPFDHALLIGAFSGFPGSPEKRMLTLNNAKIDTIAIWDFVITNAQAAFLSGKNYLHLEEKNSRSDQIIKAYNRFYDASERKNLERCYQLDRSMRDFMRQDPTRPIYHLTAPMGWVFDPSGAFQFQGKYHVSSYRNIYALLRFNSLDHYVSDDLVHWRMWPIGPIADHEFDSGGIWLSNHFVDDQGKPNVIYCAWGRKGEQGIHARSHDGMISYTDKKAIFPQYHDGHIWKEGDTWYVITMRRPENKALQNPEIAIYTSTDLDHWTERGVLFRPNEYTEKDGRGMEFPYLIPMGDKDVLMSGYLPTGVLYWIGHFDRNLFKFIPDHPEGLRIDYANPFHCFNPSAVDEKGPNGTQRRIIMALNLLPKGSVDGIPWNGAHAMPRVLSLSGNHLRQDPLPEFETLRGRRHAHQNIKITPDVFGYINTRGDALEILAEFENNDATMFGMKVRLSKDGKTYVRVFYDVKTSEYGVDGNISELYAPDDPKHGRGPSFLTNGKLVQMRIFLDKSFIETFVNGQTCTTSLKDTSPLHDKLDLFSEGGTVTCTRLDIWEMKSAF